MMDVIDGVVRPYAWGSRTAIATMRGMSSPSPHPEAELWFGAHPAAPSTLAHDSSQTLLEKISVAPHRELGPACADEFGNSLPFLVKVLAAEEPLSLQAHPNRVQARAGFAREDARGLAIDATDRNYRDANHKPELIVALSQFDALAGFRAPAQSVELLRALNVEALDPYLGLLSGQPDADGLRALFTTWLTMPEQALSELIPAVIDGAVDYLNSGQRNFAAELQTVLELSEAYPADPGVLTVLLLNHIRLLPGEGLYLGAGNLHAYLRGIGVEIMANSDNVLRGGLTTKHIDVGELLAVLDFSPTTREQLQPAVVRVGPERVYRTPAPDFRLSRVELDSTALHHASSIAFDTRGPQILTVTGGSIEVRASDGTSVTASAGQSVWLSDCDPDVIVRAASSDAVFFRALVPAGTVTTA